MRPWKQIIFFDFSRNADKALIDKLIILSEAAGANVRGVVFDMGNHTFIKDIKMFKEITYFFPNPVNEDRKVYCFPDSCHCFKNLRNHTNDDGMVITEDDGEKVTL